MKRNLSVDSVKSFDAARPVGDEVAPRLTVGRRRRRHCRRCRRDQDQNVHGRMVRISFSMEGFQ